MDVFELSSQIADDIAARWPTAATYAGIPGHDHRWPDLSPDGYSAWAADIARMRQAVAALPEPPDRWHALAGRVAETMLSYEAEDVEHGEHLQNLNSIDSPLQTMREVFEIMDTSTAEGWEAVAARLEALPAAMAGYQATLEEGRRQGMAVARRQVLAGIEQARGHSDPAPYFASLAGALEESGVGDAALAARLEAAIPDATQAFDDFAAYLESQYLPSAPERDAVGRERYIRRARQYLGATIDPEETYEWGWEEVEKLREAMHATAAEIVPGASLAEVIALLKSDPDRAARSRQEFIRIMLERQQLALSELDGAHFDVPEQIRSVEVRIAPARGALGAYYVQPSEDFSRPGCVWYSLAADQERVPLFDEISTAYHEGFPGHHLQCGVQLSLADRLSRLHRLMVWYPGYGEGWALYAERFMHEQGYLEKPEYVLGLQATQMLRACRVVIDIGSHLELPIPKDQPFHPGEEWTYDSAVEMLVDDATLDEDYARSEITRYLGWPGQAISYKVGERAILDVRDELRRGQGDAFDLRDFHRRVLGSGPVGLDLLRDLVLDGT